MDILKCRAILEARTEKFTSFFALSSSNAKKIVSQVIRSYLLITRNAEIFSSARKTVRRETTNEQFTPSTSSVILNLPCVYIATFSTNLSSCYPYVICAWYILGEAPPMRLPPQIPTTLFKRSKFWEKVEGGGGRGESSLLSGFQNGSPVANLYSLGRGGERHYE